MLEDEDKLRIERELLCSMFNLKNFNSTMCLDLYKGMGPSLLHNLRTSLEVPPFLACVVRSGREQ